MIRITTIAFFLLCVVHAQSVYAQEYMVTVKSGVFIRDSSGVQSKAVGSVKYKEVVQVIDRPFRTDFVNGIQGEWLKVKYGSHTGYIFDAYLGDYGKRDKNFPDHYPQYLRLNGACGEEQYFNNDFYWYGIFDKGSQYEISRVKPEFLDGAVSWRKSFYEKYPRVSIDRDDKPLFLIGHHDSIPDYNIVKNNLIGSRELYPGQSFLVSGGGRQGEEAYYLTCYGKVEGIQYTEPSQQCEQPLVSISDYEVHLVNLKNGITKSKELVHDVEPLNFVQGGVAQIGFIGDLNHDSIPDIIFHYRSSAWTSNTYLFMSGYSDSEIITKVAFNRWRSCRKF